MTRVVLVASRPGVKDPSNRLTVALDRIAQAGYTLISVIDPAHVKDALRLVLDGDADLIVVTQPEDFPFVRLAAELGHNAERRARPALRPSSGEESLRTRRPQPVQPAERVEPAQTEHVRRARPVDTDGDRRRAQLDRYQRTSIVRRTG